MKKIIAITAMAAAVAVSAMAVEVKGNVRVDADLLQGGKVGDDFVLSGPKLVPVNVKDADALIFDFAGEKAGGHFQAWYNNDGSDRGAATMLGVRSVNIWFKPIDMLKVTVGNVSVGTYTEQINWWKVTAAESIDNWNSWNGRWSSYSSVEGWGASVDLNVGNLWVNAAIAPGANSMFSTAKDAGYGAYGLIAKYTIMDGLTAAVSWRDEGKDARKLLKVGADYSNGGFYGYVNAIVNFSNGKLAGIGIDNYFKYSLDALTLQAAIPVVIRTTGDAGDSSYLNFDLKASYSLGAVTPYLVIENKDVAPLQFDDKLGDNFGMNIIPGATFSCGECSFDVAFKATIAGGNFSFGVPVSMKVSM